MSARVPGTADQLRAEFTHAWCVRVDGRAVGAFWPAHGGGYTLRLDPGLARARLRHFSPAEGLDGLVAFLSSRFGGAVQLVPPDDV